MKLCHIVEGDSILETIEIKSIKNDRNKILNLLKQHELSRRYEPFTIIVDGKRYRSSDIYKKF
jgi:hypothetical protein